MAVAAKARVHSGDDVMEITPVPVGRRISNEELAKGLNQVHLCFEEHKKETLTNFKQQTGAIRDLDGKVSDLHTQIQAQAMAFGLVDGQKKSAGVWTTWEYVWRTAVAAGGAMGALFTLYRIIVVVGPTLGPVGHALAKVAGSP